jgi:ubiquinone/menaquinone biosynthesis C-methylase UbiE
MAILDDIRAYWDADAAGYDAVPNHHPVDLGVRAAWAAAVARHLPPPPARVLDCGAGTGFLSLVAARLGHSVVSLDLSEAMLGRLRSKAIAEGLQIDVVAGPAERPPDGPFDAVIERHLLWTLADPIGTLRAWRSVAPNGRLLAVEGLWGPADPVERVRGWTRSQVARLLGQRHDHHAPYPAHVLAQTPLAGRTTPAAVTRTIEEAGWRASCVERLADVEWTLRLTLPPLLRPFGVAPVFIAVASA